MTDRDDPNRPDPELMTLFRSDLEAQGTVLRSSLNLLRHNPDATEPLNILLQTMSSLRGTAQLVELRDGVALVKAMEECFLAVKKGKLRLQPGHIDAVTRGVDLLFQITEAVNDENGKTAYPSPEKIRETLAAIGAPTNASSSKGLKTKEKSSPSLPEKTDREIPKSASPLIDDALLEMLRGEVATHIRVLSDGLLILEETPQALDVIESLMRAAHSVKGSARIVGLDAVVKMAHAMEDCFVAAQKNEILLEPEHIDVLLKAVDLFAKIREITSDGAAQWQARYGQQIESLTEAVSSIRTGKKMKTCGIEAAETGVRCDAKTEGFGNSEPESPCPPSPSSPSLPTSASPCADRTVRVSAPKIERLVGLAGEVMVGARWLSPFSASFTLLRKNHFQLASILGELQERLQQEGGNPPSLRLIEQAKAILKDGSLILAERLKGLEKFTGRSTGTAERLYHEVVSVRMRPFDDGVREFPRLVRDLAKQLGKKAGIRITGRSTEVDRDILDRLDAPLNHLIRNALDHGIEYPDERKAAGKPETGTLSLEAEHRSGMLMIRFSDDGRGVSFGKLREQILRKGLVTAEMVEKITESELMEFLFLPGFSTSEKVTEVSGRGVGLNVVQTMVQEVSGVVRAVSKPGEGLSFHLQLPLTLSIVRTLLVEIAGEPYAFPLARIDRCVRVQRDEVKKVEGRQYFSLNGRNISLINIHQVLGIPEPPAEQDKLPVVVVSDRTEAYALVVDRFIEECDLVVRPLDRRLGKVPNISATALMLDNSPVLIFDVEDLIRSTDNLLAGKRLNQVLGLKETKEKTSRRILVVDDSITVRELERKMLENEGYEVEVAVDGMDGWNAVRTGHYDLVITDVDMPRMNGIDLILHIRQHHDFQSLPVIIVSYKDREEDRLEGLKAGANYYLTKSNFQDNSFLDAVADLIGEVEPCELPSSTT